MRQDVEALEGSGDQLACLVLRLVAEHSPCAETFLLASVAGGDSDGEANASTSHAQGLICDALRKLKSLGFIEFTQEQIAVTDDGRRFLEGSLGESASTQQRSSSKPELPAWLARYVPRVQSIFGKGLAGARKVAGSAWQFGNRAIDSASRTWQQKVAPKIAPARAALGVVLWRLAEGGRKSAKRATFVLEGWRRQFAPLLTKSAQSIKAAQAKLSKSARAGLPKSTQARLSRTAQALKSAQTRLSKSADAKLPKSAQATSLPTPKPLRHRYGMSPEVSLGGGLLLVIAVAGTVGWFSSQRGEQGAPATQIAATEAAVAPSAQKRPDPVATGSITPSAIEQPPVTGEEASPAEVTPQIAEEEPSPADPVVAAIQSKLKDASFRSRAHSDDLAALEDFYGKQDASPIWMTDTGFSAKAKTIVGEIEKAADWGLPQDAFDLPSATDVPPTADAKAIDEVKLDLAILKYARFARGGRVSPGRISAIFDQKPQLRDPKLVLAEIQVSAEPDVFLRSMHPKQEQFEKLRQALIKARAESKTKGRRPESEPIVQRLVVNMERWRWMPPELGSYYVWNNVPAFTVRVIKGGKSIYVEKAVVGQLKYATPIFSADMRSIAFNPEWVVPDTIKREDLAPRLRQGGLFGPDTSVLREHRLSVSYQGRPVDPDSIDWGRANIHQFAFTQPPGPDNVLGKLKFNFPNKHAIYMHDTVQPEFFDETVRSLSHGCIRVKQPDRLAQLLLAEDKGWSAGQVKSLLAKGNNSIVALNRPVPVHLTYFTAVVDEQGKMQTFGDLYGLDSRMSAVLFEKGVKFGAPAPTVEAKTNRAPQPQRGSRRDSGGGLAQTISGLFGN